MEIEAVPNTSESREARLLREYREAVVRYEAQKQSEVRSDVRELMFGDRPAANDEERAVVEQELQQAACEGDAEAFAQRGEPHAERVSRMFAQVEEAKLTILKLYLDAKNMSEEVAEAIRREQPWVETHLREAANDDTYLVERKEVA